MLKILLPYLVVGISIIAMSGCVKTPDVNIPSPGVPNIDMSPLAKYRTCDQKDSEQPKVSSHTSANRIIVEDEIDSKDIETVDCDGKVTKSHGPERQLAKTVVLPAAPESLQGIKYVEVENYRACAKIRANVNKDANESELLSSIMSSAEADGRIHLILVDGISLDLMNLNVHDGLNILKVRYFGACKQLKDEYNRYKDTPNDSYLNCAVDNEIGNQDFELDVRVQRPEVSGVKKVDACYKKN